MVHLIRLTFRRARQERLAQVAGSLSFTTLLSIVPFLSVCLALFTHFPVFRRFEVALEDILLKSLLPADISRTVLRYLHQFAANANGLTLVGSGFILVAAVAVMLTVENAFNQIWNVKRNRPFLRRVGLYLLMLVAGPLMLGASLWATSYVVGASMGYIGELPPSARFVLNLGPVVLGTAAFAGLFHFVPNTPVRKRDAFTGGLLASLAVELGKHGFAAYLMKVPTYKAVYGAFAVVPVFLIWVYFSWFVTMAAALVTANLGQGKARTART